MEIAKALRGWSPTDLEYEIYEEWTLYQKYPYAGGFLDQPLSFRELRRKYGLFEEFHRINEGLNDPKEKK